MKVKKPATIFDHLGNITWKKTPWDTLDEASQKSFSPYLINRWLSMNPDYIEIVDMFQQYTIGPLSKKHVYQLYFDFYIDPLGDGIRIRGIDKQDRGSQTIAICSLNRQELRLERVENVIFPFRDGMSIIRKK